MLVSFVFFVISFFSEYCQTVGSSSGSQFDELTEDTHELHESIRFSTFSLNKAIAALVGTWTGHSTVVIIIVFV